MKIFIKFVGFREKIKLLNNMGKGDRKTKRGKIVRGTYGVRRRKKKPAGPITGNYMKTADKDLKVTASKKKEVELAAAGANKKEETGEAKASKKPRASQGDKETKAIKPEKKESRAKKEDKN